MSTTRRTCRRTAVALAVVTATAACRSTATADRTPATRPSTTTPSQAAPTSAVGPTRPSTPVRVTGSSGFGATKILFRASHAEVASLEPGCCYAPIVRYDGGEPVPTWNIANSPGDRVTFLTHDFARGTDEATATRLVEAQDLPADAEAVRSRVIDRTCRFTVYRSRALARTLSTGVFSVRLFSPTPAGAAPRYMSSSVEQAKIITGDLDLCTV